MRGICSACTPPYTLVNELCAQCGDRVLDSGEQCDDGNTLAGDGCSNICMTENLCGDGTVTYPEECDDRNT